MFTVTMKSIGEWNSITGGTVAAITDPTIWFIKVSMVRRLETDRSDGPQKSFILGPAWMHASVLMWRKKEMLLQKYSGRIVKV